MRWAGSVTAWMVLALLSSPAAAAPHRVTDLFSGKASLPLAPYPTQGFEHGGVSYFPAADAQHGYELWRTDGTAAGTYRLTDICAGACDSGAAALGLFQHGIYLIANDGEHGAALWRTDGTPGHEERVTGVCDGACLTGLQYSLPWHGALWFLVPGPRHTPALWTSDLTAGGTRAVANLCTDLAVCGFGASSEAFLGGPDPSGQGLLLWVYTDAQYLLRTDGTAQGTALLHRFHGPSAAQSRRAATAVRRGSVRQEATAGSPLFFLDGSDLWTTDGTPAGTHFVRSLAGLVSSLGTLQSAEVVDGVWYGIFTYGEWLRSDGTADGTIVLAHVPDGFNPTVTHVGSTVLAITVQGVWRAGPTPATTVKVFDWAVDDILTVVEQPPRAFVLAWLGGGTIWTTDGTAAGTLHVELPAGAPVDQYEMTGFAGGVLMSRGGDQLWRVDATATRVTPLHDFQPADGPSLTEGAAVLGRRLLFYARTGATKMSLFSSDGTGPGTAILTPAADESFYDPYDYGPPGHSFTRFGGNKVLFSANSLWITDGSADGTRRLSQQPNYAFPAEYSPVAAIGKELVFGGHVLGGPSCDPGETEPWVTDGLPRNTHEILDLNPYFYPGGGSQCEFLRFSSDPGPGISFGSKALFAADDLVHGRELFATDGTAAGTRLVADINPRTVPNTVTDPPGVPPRIGEGSNPSDFVALGSRVVFVADDGSTGRELWITNGTAHGTRRVVDLLPGPESSLPHDLVALRGKVYFIARHGGGEGLFESDGTALGTALVSDLELAGLPTRAAHLTVAGRRLFFAGFNESTGTELWTSEGTPQTTRLVADLRPGPRGSAPQSLTAVRGVLVFAADDGVSGLEPWRSDGTAAGTFPLGDIAAGESSSNPGPFWVVGDQVLFGADDGEHGRELWALPMADVVRPSAGN